MCTNFLAVQQEVNSRVCLTAVPKQKTCLWSSVWERKVFQHCQCGNVFLETCSQFRCWRSTSHTQVGNVIHFLAPTIRCHLMLLTTFQATFKRVQSQPCFSFLRGQRSSHSKDQKNRSPNLRHASWTHHADLNWLLERIKVKWLLERSHRARRGTRIGHTVIIREAKMHKKQYFFEETPSFIPEAKKDLHKQCSGIHQSISGLSMDAWPESLHRSQTNGTADRAVRRLQEGTATAMVQCGLPDQWRDRAKECCCCLRNAYNKMADSKTTYEKGCCVTFDGLLIPFGAKVSCKPISREECASIWQRDASQNLRGIRATCEERMVRRTCLSWIAKTSRTWHPQISTSNGSSTRKSHKKDIRRFHVQTELSNSSIFLDPNAAKCLPGKPWGRWKRHSVARRNLHLCLFPQPTGKSKTLVREVFIKGIWTWKRKQEMRLNATTDWDTNQALSKRRWTLQKSKLLWINTCDELKNFAGIGFQESTTKTEVVRQTTYYGTEYLSFCSLHGSLPLWKHAELANHLQRSAKGRIVLWVDNVEDDSGYKVLVTEHGASASQVAAAKFLDVMSRLPSLAGEATEGILGIHAFPPGWWECQRTSAHKNG